MGHMVMLFEALRYKTGKTAGLIPEGLLGIFHEHNPSGRL
jgi:hypothetical protein